MKESSEYGLEPADIRILNLLQKDARISNAELAKLAGLSASACWRRMRQLESSGVIERYGAQVNAAACGLDFQAIVHVQLERHERRNIDEFIRLVNTRPEVQECYATTGQADYHLRVLCRDLEAYNSFLEDFLFRIAGVANAQTNLVLREIKRSQAIAL